ncbi:MAG: nucleotidyltransferase family protein [Myxococcota bacterium]
MSEYGIILAAGGSTRMGEPKALLQLDGQPLVRRAIDAVREAGAQPLVVLGHRSPDIATRIDTATYVVNPDWRDGMSTSLRCGVESLPPGVERALVLTVDQPDVTGALLTALLEPCRSGRDAAGTRYADGSLGVPACFHARLFAELSGARGDVGARGVLRSAKFDIASIDAPRQTLDVDTPEQWAAYLETRRREDTT